jgi:NDP-sugar pyrophosphorylase family protein
MKAVILAAGRGSRMKELTETLPKPMLLLKGKNLLQHKIEALPAEFDEVIIVVGYMKEKIMDFFDDKYDQRKITYVHMDKLEGTGKALWLCRDFLDDKFIVLMGDDIYSTKDIKECLKHEWAVLINKKHVDTVGGAVILDEHQRLLDILEGSHVGPETLLYTGLCVLTPHVFEYPLVKLKNKEEYGLPQTLVQAIGKIPIAIVESTFWLQLSNPEDLARAEKEM